MDNEEIRGAIENISNQSEEIVKQLTKIANCLEFLVSQLENEH